MNFFYYCFFACFFDCFLTCIHDCFHDGFQNVYTTVSKIVFMIVSMIVSMIGSAGRVRKWMADREAYSLYIFKPEDKFRLFCQDLTSQVLSSSDRTSPLRYCSLLPGPDLSDTVLFCQTKPIKFNPRRVPIKFLYLLYILFIFYPRIRAGLTSWSWCSSRPTASPWPWRDPTYHPGH